MDNLFQNYNENFLKTLSKVKPLLSSSTTIKTDWCLTKKILD